MSERARIYRIRDRASGEVARYVRAKTLNSALRAVADEQFEATHATTDMLYQAMRAPGFDVLDAVEGNADASEESTDASE